MGVIIFNGRSSADYNIQVEHYPGYETPTREYEVVHVPGRNGDIYIDKGSYQNVTRTYEIAVATPLNDKFTYLANGVSEWLHSAVDYARLEDSYEPEYYRMAVYEEAMGIDNVLNRGGRSTISFTCKPQRFLKSGDLPIIFTKQNTITNPTGFKSLPIITVYGIGSGTFRIGNYTVSISEIGNSVTINSDIQDAYNGVQNRNQTITLGNGFPKMDPGEISVSFTGGITSMEVIPKWWTL